MNRDDFPFLQRAKAPLYFDTAATALKPACVIDAMSDFYRTSYGTVHRGVYELSREATARYSAARANVARFLNARLPEEIVFTRGTTAALNLVARSFAKAFLGKGDEILLSEIEHHSNLVPWQMVAEECGAKLKFIPVNDAGELCLEAYHALLTERVKIVSLAHISNVIGTLHPLQKIVEAAHRMGAKVCIDGAQAAPHLPIDVTALDVDFYAFSGHKLYGPTGIGVLYGKHELLSLLPPIEGGGDMIETVNLHTSIYAPPPLRFEAGTPMIAEVIGLNAALHYLTTTGLSTIAAHENALTAYALSRLTPIPGLSLLGTPTQRGPLISFTIANAHPLDLATLLDARGIALRTGHHCSQIAMQRFNITSCLRLSFGLYNTPEEIDAFIDALQDILPLLQ